MHVIIRLAVILWLLFLFMVTCTVPMQPGIKIVGEENRDGTMLYGIPPAPEDFIESTDGQSKAAVWVNVYKGEKEKYILLICDRGADDLLPIEEVSFIIEEQASIYVFIDEEAKYVREYGLMDYVLIVESVGILVAPDKCEDSLSCITMDEFEKIVKADNVIMRYSSGAGTESFILNERTLNRFKVMYKFYKVRNRNERFN